MNVLYVCIDETLMKYISNLDLILNLKWSIMNEKCRTIHINLVYFLIHLSLNLQDNLIAELNRAWKCLDGAMKESLTSVSACFT
jgi:hypothetical protein